MSNRILFTAEQPPRPQGGASKLPKLWVSVALAVALAGCADPVGAPQPKPLDYQEEAQATTVYRKYSPQFRAMDGVLNTYLTAHNNPREIVVVVKDKASRKAAREKFGKQVDGLKVSYKLVERQTDDDAPIEEVPRAVPDTWWGKVVHFLQTLPVPWATRRDI